MINTINLEDTRFVYGTNFAGDPEKDRFGDIRRKANILVRDPELVRDLIKDGIRVRETKPFRDQDPGEFEPEYFVTAILKYRTRSGDPVRYPPKVYLVKDDGDPVLLNEDTVACIDDMRVKNVNVVLNPYEYDPVNHEKNLYIRTIYIEQALDDDPYAERYRRRREEENQF